MDITNAKPRRPVAVSVGRRGALTPGQRETWQRLWPKYGFSVDRESPAEGWSGPAAWFGRPAPLVLDIGFGNGAATAALAAQLPDHDLLAVERYQPGIANLLKLVEEQGLGNVRFAHGDAVQVLDHLISAASLAMVRILFPDPWPKTRHHKRRLITPETVSLITDRLCVGGVLHVATDDANYAEAIAGSIADEPRLRPAQGAPARPTTVFEGRAHQAGRSVAEFVVSRHKTDPPPGPDDTQ